MPHTKLHSYLTSPWVAISLAAAFVTIVLPDQELVAWTLAGIVAGASLSGST